MGIIYKWKHSKKIISSVLLDKYNDLLNSNWMLTYENIERDVNQLFGKSFEEFIENNRLKSYFL